MWRGEGEVHRVAPICARTCIGVETISFRHNVDNFSTMKPNQKHIIRIGIVWFRRMGNIVENESCVSW
ncbi:unnamed protein product [Larinioides sclopetarius]|uniref:Uncharacterized protein n=1 Tax=Larinioides sclopetarius TaxID=280406 RepID=A0AAV2B5L4_9ARAC